MPALELDISNPADHPAAAKALLDWAGSEKVFLFEAPMGAGKTTFIKAIGTYLGVTDSMSSPTYSIVNEYLTTKNGRIFHFDLYRLTHSSELLDLGFEEYLDRGLVFIEWPELALPFLDRFVIIIIRTENNKRYLYAEKN